MECNSIEIRRTNRKYSNGYGVAFFIRGKRKGVWTEYMTANQYVNLFLVLVGIYKTGRLNLWEQIGVRK